MPGIVAAAFIFFILLSGISFSEETKNLEKIVITPSRLKNTILESSRSVTILHAGDFASSVYGVPADLIGNIAGIDIRRRGPEGVQADVNIRGASFEENSVLIDGIKVNDPQTGHFNMDLPLMVSDIERIEILKGPASSAYGPNSFGGVINIITKKPDKPEVTLSAEGGSFDFFSGSLSASYPLGALKNRFSIEERRSTGYMPETEFNILSLSDSAAIETDFGKYDFFFGYLKKDFGADSFYSNLYNNEEEHIDTRFFKVSGFIENGSLTVEPKLFLRRHRDKFILDRNKPGWQTNYHTTYNYGGEIAFVFEHPFLNAAYGAEVSRDTIDSTSLQAHTRTTDGIYLELSPHIIDNLSVDLGIRIDYFSDFGLECSPSVGVSYLIDKRLTLRSVIARAYRIPTFTDLYYNDAANIGNPDLKPESCWVYEAGVDYRMDPFEYSASFFRRNSRNTIDWTRLSAKDPWRASNIGSTETNGFELSVSLAPKWRYKDLSLNRLFIGYTVLDVYAKHDYLSKYALDYLKQHISGGVDFDMLGFSNSWVLNYKKRVGDSGYIVVDMKLAKEIAKKKGLKVAAFLEISNLFDADYSEQSDIPMPGRWIKSGGRIEF